MDQTQPNSLPPDGPFGIHQVRVDDKGRLKLPVRFKQHLETCFPGERLFVTSVDGCTGRIYPVSVWKKNLKFLDEFTEDPKRARRIVFVANDNGQDGETDSNGRILIHPKLRQTLGIEPASEDDNRHVVWLQWIRDGIDIYNKAVYEKLAAAAYGDSEENADFMFAKGLK